MPWDDLLQELHVYGAGGPVVDPVGGVRAVGDEVDGVLTPRRLGPAEALPLLRTHAASEVLEYLAVGELLQDLLYYADALPYLAYPNPVGGHDVARLVGDDVEVHVGIPAVRVVPAHVEAYPEIGRAHV